MSQQPTVIDRGVAVMDPNHSTSGIPNTMAVNSDGSINTTATGTFEAGAEATAADPSYSEATQEPLSQDLSGHLRTKTNLAQVNGQSVNVGLGTAGTGTQRVSTSSDSTLGLVAGAAIIGKVGIDQTTPGTTNGVQVNAALPAGANVIGHVILDTTSTTAVTQATAANLNATIVGAGAAGTANAGVVTIQGIASMTPILATITPVSSATLTASQVTVPATANGIVILAANSSRKGATISNPSSVTVFIQQGSTGVTTSNGFGIPSGSSYNIDEPLYTGAIYGIVATATQVVTVVELT